MTVAQLQSYQYSLPAFIVGDEAVKLWVVKGEHKQDNRLMLKIACPDCGYEISIRRTAYRQTRECKRCRFVVQNRNNYGKHRGCGELTKTFYNHFKQTARRRGVEFTVGIEYLWSLAEAQEMKCALSGLPIVFPTVSSYNGNPVFDEVQYQRITKGYGMVAVASLDRIDSEKPYEEGNVQWVHKNINIMKNGYAQDEFIYLCHLVSSLHANPELSTLKGNKKGKVSVKVQRLEGEDFQPITPPRAPGTPCG